MNVDKNFLFNHELCDVSTEYHYSPNKKNFIHLNNAGKIIILLLYSLNLKIDIKFIQPTKHFYLININSLVIVFNPQPVVVSRLVKENNDNNNNNKKIIIRREKIN